VTLPHPLSSIGLASAELIRHNAEILVDGLHEQRATTSVETRGVFQRIEDRLTIDALRL